MKKPEDIAILADFLQRYASVSLKQLAGVQEHMSGLCEEVMDGIKGINEQHGDKEKLAKSVHVKGEHGDFADHDVSVVLNREQGDEQAMRATLDEFSDAAKDAGAQLKMHMSGLEDVSSGLQDGLMKMIGSMSMDDVLGQRLEHVSDSIVLLRDYVQKMSECSEQEKAFEDATMTMRSQIFRAYTTEEEKEVYRQVFPDSP